MLGGLKPQRMKKDENIKLLEELGFAYEKFTNNFWHIESETYFDLPIEQCDKDTAAIVRLVVAFEKDLAYFNGTCAVQNQMRRLLGFDK